MSDQQIEQEIQAKGLTAPRVSLADLQANIAHTEIVKHVSVTGQVLRWAVLTTHNGFAVTGRPSASASPENDDAELGEKIAIENATQELWPLMGYALKQRIHETLQGIDGLLATRIPILDQITELCWAIEKCGASLELTDAVTKASALRKPISELVQQAIALGLDTGRMSVSTSEASTAHRRPDPAKGAPKPAGHNPVA